MASKAEAVQVNAQTQAPGSWTPSHPPLKGPLSQCPWDPGVREVCERPREIGEERPHCLQASSLQTTLPCPVGRGHVHPADVHSGVRVAASPAFVHVAANITQMFCLCLCFSLKSTKRRGRRLRSLRRLARHGGGHLHVGVQAGAASPRPRRGADGACDGRPTGPCSTCVLVPALCMGDRPSGLLLAACGTVTALHAPVPQRRGP